MNKTSQLDWMLFVIRLFVGAAFILHGGQKIIITLCTTGLNSLTPLAFRFGGLSLSYLAPFTEVVGGSLIVGGIAVEIGTLLVVPTLFFVASLQTNCLINQISFRYAINLVMLTVAVGMCGPGKWAIWDPGKSLRKKIF